MRKHGVITFFIEACLIQACIVAACSVAFGAAQDAVERGRYLVEGVLTCGNCHSPRGPGGAVDATKLYSGGPQTWDEPTFTVKGSNITPDAETGIGRWSAEDMKRAIQQGVRPNGSHIAPIMPSKFYKVFTPGDLDAVVAYLRSVPAVHNQVTAPIYKAALPMELFPAADKPPEADLRDPVERGHYLATIGHCMECHTPDTPEHHDFAGSLGKGGQKFPGPWGESVSRNITSHKEKGIGAWSDAEIKRAVTEGVRPDGSKLKPPMGFAWYARMNGEDLDALVAYLRTVPPKE